MIKKILIFFLMLMSVSVWAQEEVDISLEHAKIDIHDKQAILRGGKFFANVCMACHALIYLRYDKVAQSAGVTYEKMPTKITQWPFGIKPPDLSLEVSRRGADWVYTYLHSFYFDPKRPTLANNLLLPNTAMSPILMPFQGKQILLPKNEISQNLYGGRHEWYDLVKLEAQGSMTPQQFDATINDVVTFLAYASTPYQAEQEKIGWWVIGYLFILFILMYQLKKSYWRTNKVKRE